MGVLIQYRPGKLNANADALSRRPQASAPQEGLAEAEVQVAAVGSEAVEAGDDNITSLLCSS